MSGTCLTEQLKALHIFLSASSSHSYLLEFLEHGGVLCLQELCISPRGKEKDKKWALRVLACVANAGTRYKETICECYGLMNVNFLATKQCNNQWSVQANGYDVFNRPDYHHPKVLACELLTAYRSVRS
ncbi:unnamed protein product [Dicrocoelium dendriticum]|nr:unnamed protein product [Dicrocoelium dendriticum]